MPRTRSTRKSAPLAAADPAALWQMGMASWNLWADASAVVWLRSMRIMQGGKGAEREARRMVEEKLLANATLGMALWPTLAAGGAPAALGNAAIKHYSAPVRGNRRRLESARH